MPIGNFRSRNHPTRLDVAVRSIVSDHEEGTLCHVATIFTSDPDLAGRQARYYGSVGPGQMPTTDVYRTNGSSSLSRP